MVRLCAVEIPGILENLRAVVEHGRFILGNAFHDLSNAPVIKPCFQNISVDLNETVKVGVTVNGVSGDLEYGEMPTWITLNETYSSSTMSSADLTVFPSYTSLQGRTWPVNITATDSRWEAGLSRGERPH